MRSPCRDCDHHLAGRSKECRRCRDCKRRIAALDDDAPIPLAGSDQLYFQPPGLIRRYGWGPGASDWDLMPN
jgi:hypothetical protein